MMKTYMTKILTVLMLMMFSMGASADVKIFYGEKGEELKTGETKIQGDNGTIAIEQKTSDDGSSTTIYLTFSPDNGYTISTDNIEVYAVISTGSSSTRTPEISGSSLKLNEETSKAPEKRYSVKIDSNLGLWIKKAEFQVKKRDGSKDNPATESGLHGDGYYYIKNIFNNIDYYLKPAAGSTTYPTNAYYQSNPKMPFLTTNTTGSLWILKSNGGYYQIIHAEDGKYVTINGDVVGGSNKHRKRMHLESISPAGDDNDFVLTANGDYYNISHKTMTEGNHKYWNPSGKNQTYDDGGSSGYSGIIGILNDANDAGSKWNLVFVKKCVTPEIAVDDDGNVTITSLTSGATIYYTDDDTDPATSGTRKTYNGTFSLGTATKIRAIATKSEFENSEEAVYNSTSCKTPTIVLNKENGLTTITPHADDTGATIYYTIDGSTPTTSSTIYTEPFTLSVDATEIKAIAAFANDGTDASDVTEQVLTKLAPPTFTKNGATVTINKPTKESDGTTALVGPEAVEVRYNQNNNDPTSSSTLYSTAITLAENFNQTIIKARAYKPGYVKSEVASQNIDKCATPTIINNYDGTITLSCATEGATIRYTYSTTETAPSDPGTGSTTVGVDGIVTLPAGVKILKIRAFKAGLCVSAVQSYHLPVCPAPEIRNNNGMITITCEVEGASIKYTTSADGTPTTDYDPDAHFSLGSATIVRAYASHAGYVDSEIAQWRSAAVITSASDVDLDDPNGNYMINGSFSGSIGTSEKPFKGTIDGQGIVISGRTAPLVLYADNATIKNVILDNVTISEGNNVGAICNEATGATRIYNCGVLATDSEVETDKDGYTHITSCSSTISGTGYVGGIVGLLDGSSRVINCFSYANITGGNLVGGIVGKNAFATTNEIAKQKTMVMNCMFYGDIDYNTTTSRAPIYNGEIITNRSDAKGVSNFNYFWAGASYVQDQKITSGKYNCALSAETRFLQRFEFFRHLLNSNRALAAWWATGSRDKKDEMMKWVMEPSQIGTSKPYPILKASYDSDGHVIKYPSVVNIDADHAEAFSGSEENKKTQYNQGRKFTTLTINIQNASSGAPTGASIVTTSVTPNITDKDPKHFNFNYYKVQLPYYNDVGTKNYTGNRVVTGWKIVSISSADATNGFSTGSEATASVSTNDATKDDITLTTPYNFADRHSTQKDNYENSGRIFNQGAYFDVPEGVTSITIEPYWAKCVYVSDQYPDVVYNQAMSTATNVTTVGGGSRYTNGQPFPINGEDQVVYTSMSAAVEALDPENMSEFVYDNAIVLVGNVHSLNLSSERHKFHYTIMSIDLDKDNEPDYSYILRFDSRKRVHPVRVDFLNVIGLGMAQKSSDGTGTYNFGIMQPYGWFEVTNTGLFRVTQFEYDVNGRDENRDKSPMILHGGVIEQWVTVGGREQTIKAANSVSYYHVGGNVWFKEFHLGVHQDKIQDEFVTPHPPISVTGGDYDIFYLTGYYNSPNINYPDNAECYINGGRFGKVAGTGMQGLGKTGGVDDTGNIIWQIDNADIDEFYAGGINAAHKAEGNIFTVISNSRVDQFCGGPKFGDMNSGKTVVTNAKDCIFRTFFGAGYGGNSYNRRYPQNKESLTSDPDWNGWVGTEYKNDYDADYKGVSTRIDYQYIPQSDNTKSVARLFVDYVSFSLATTHNVTSKLTGCTITQSPLGRLKLSYGLGNFYGGGSLGKVTGPVKSTLINCTVEGNVFGAGYSATKPKVSVMAPTFQTPPRFDTNLGAYLEAVLPATIEPDYEWKPLPDGSTTYVDNTNHILYAKAEDLEESNLGSVNGSVTLTIKGNSKIGTLEGETDSQTLKEDTGNVYGGGEESCVKGSTNTVTVNLQGNTEVLGNVFGGGNKGLVEGSTQVNIQQ